MSIKTAVAIPLLLALVRAAVYASEGPGDDLDPAPWSMADEIVASIELPRIPKLAINITDFGTVASDGQDDRAAILAAIEAASQGGGGRVILPAGEWYSAGPVVLQSRIEFHLAEGATLLFSPRAADYLRGVRRQWEGTMMRGYLPLVYGAGVEDIAITGKGTIDGNTNSEFHAWDRDEAARRVAAESVQQLRRLGRKGKDGSAVEERIFGEGSNLRPSAIQFLGAKRVLLEGYTIRNSPFWVNHLVFTEQATMRRVTVESHFGNNDGIDVDSSSYVLIEDNHFRTGDDSVVVKSGRDRDGRDIDIPSEYVVVRNNDMGGEDGIGLGSEMSGGVRFVFFENNVLRRGASAVRFKSSLERGGVVEHIRVRNMSIEEFDNLIWFQLVRGDEVEPQYPGTYRDILFENLVVERAGRVLHVEAPAVLPLSDVTLRNVKIREAEQVLDIENVEDLRFDNVTVGGQRVDGKLSWRKK